MAFSQAISFFVASGLGAVVTRIQLTQENLPLLLRHYIRSYPHRCYQTLWLWVKMLLPPPPIPSLEPELCTVSSSLLFCLASAGLRGSLAVHLHRCPTILPLSQL